MSLHRSNSKQTVLLVKNRNIQTEVWWRVSANVRIFASNIFYYKNMNHRHNLFWRFKAAHSSPQQNKPVDSILAITTEHLFFCLWFIISPLILWLRLCSLSFNADKARRRGWCRDFLFALFSPPDQRIVCVALPRCSRGRLLEAGRGATAFISRPLDSRGLANPINLLFDQVLQAPKGLLKAYRFRFVVTQSVNN